MAIHVPMALLCIYNGKIALTVQRETARWQSMCQWHYYAQWHNSASSLEANGTMAIHVPMVLLVLCIMAQYHQQSRGNWHHNNLYAKSAEMG